MTDARTRTLLRCGIAAGPLYLVVGLGQALTREGFDMSRHALSLLSNGDLGWIQILNFLATGALIIAGALGVRRALSGSRGGTCAPILLAVYGIGLIGAGVFVADPGFGFPPGTVAEGTGMSRSGLLHFVFGGLGFYGLIGACFVFAWRFRKQGRSGWSLYCVDRRRVSRQLRGDRVGVDVGRDDSHVLCGGGVGVDLAFGDACAPRRRAGRHTDPRRDDS